MTNYDKHKGEILKLAKERYSDFYAAEALAAHDISGLADADNIIKWLFDEYEPPLLKNGNDLKPGDWIMVKIFEDGEWAKRQFAFFHDGWFYYLRGGSNFAQLHLYGLLRSEQARLPMEGE